MTIMGTTTEQTGKAKKAAKAGRKNAIGGFITDKLDGRIMRDFVRSHGIEGIDVDVTDEQLGVALAQHFKETVAEEDLVRCESCEGVSSADYETCPFCGVADDVEDAEGDDLPSDEPSASALNDAEEPAEIIVVEEPPAKKNATSKKAKETAMETHVNGSNGTTKKGGLALVKTGESALTTGDLDKAVGEVKKLRTAGVVAYWELGRKIVEINERGLWKLRVENGKAKFKSFEAFAHHELGMTAAHAYNAMDCARGYENAESIREIGSTSKAVLLLKAAPEDRDEIKADIKAGATKKAVGEKVAASRKKHGSPKKDKQQAKAGTKSAATKAATTKREEKVTVASIEGTKTIKLYKRPATMKNLDLSTLDFAKKLGDQPFGRYELTNGVVQYFAVQQKEDGTLVIKIETRREE
jgi:hypothetical protein